MNQRSFIRNAVVAILSKADLDVKKIEQSKPTPDLLNQVSVVTVYNGTETPSIISGTEFVPQQYQKQFQLHIDVITTDLPNAEEWLDEQSGKIEDALGADPFLERITKEIDPEACTNFMMGARLEDVSPFSSESDAEHVWYGTGITYTYIYDQSVVPDWKLKEFLSYFVQITKTNVDQNTVDPVLIEAEGTTN